ncbi:MAG: hypothetical protein KDD53_05695, partial [Bdellovibrionales bacterium]|nr:hypothetical protein [Bdellovibrionales bacterium]
AANEGQMRVLQVIEDQYPTQAKLCFEGEDYQRAAKTGFSRWLNKAEKETRLKLNKAPAALHLSEATMIDREVQEQIRRKIIESIVMPDNVASLVMLEAYVPEFERMEVARLTIPKLLVGRSLSASQKSLIGKYLKDLDPRTLEGELPNAHRSLCINLGISSFGKFVEFLEKHPNLMGSLGDQRKTEDMRLQPEDLRLANSLGLHLTEIEELRREDFDIQRAVDTGDIDSIVQGLFSFSSAWSDKESVQAPFLAGAEVFGVREMLRFSHSREATRHDALQDFKEIVALYHRLHSECGVSLVQFQRNILAHVNKDRGTYSEGRSFHHLNSIARACKRRISDILTEARGITGLARLGELVSAFEEPSKVGEDWKHLKRYAKIVHIVGQQKAVVHIEKLRATQDPLDAREADWIETVALHPDSNVSLEAVLQFATEPAKFLERPGSALENALAPINYCKVEHLDLSPEELARAYRIGQLDPIQALPEMSITYLLPTDLHEFESTREALDYALGTGSDGYGAAMLPKKLYHRIKHLLPEGVDVVQYIHGEEIPADVEREIEKLLFESKLGLRGIPRKFRAVIHKASSPEGSIVGDDTACCMPFGSPKNTHYMYNPNCSFFTVQIEKPDGGWRTIAQSVVSIDRETGVPFPELKEGTSGGWGISEVLADDILRPGELYFEADNIEMARNYRADWTTHVSLIYKSFARAYVEKISGIRPINEEEMPIGRGYTDVSLDLDVRENTMCKVVPTSYTDNGQSSCYVVELDQPRPFVGEVVREVETMEAWPDQFSPGVSDLTSRDVLQAAYINDLVFPHQDPFYNLYRLQNAIVAKDYNNHLKNRANLSIKYVSPDGTLVGYMLAYHGKLDEDTRRAAKIEGEQEIVFMSLIAGHPNQKDAGGRMLFEFIRRYQEHYLDAGNPLLILTELREGTTYEFAKKRLERLTKTLGTGFEMIEIGEVRQGEEICHRVLIVPSDRAEDFKKLIPT